MATIVRGELGVVVSRIRGRFPATRERVNGYRAKYDNRFHHRRHGGFDRAVGAVRRRPVRRAF